MKQSYTQFNTLLKKYAHNVNLNYADALENFYTDCSIRFKGGIEKWDELPSKIFNRMSLEKQLLDGNCIHIYIEDYGFYEWLVSCCKDEKEHDCLVNIPGSSFPCDCDLTKFFCFHFPTSSKLTSMMCDLHIRKTGNKFCSGNLRGHYSSKNDDVRGCNDGDEYDFTVQLGVMYKFGLETRCEEFLDDQKFLVGLGMYINCFPETVKDGVPEDLKHPSQHKSNNPVTIGIAKPVRAEKGEHASPCGHFRRGHFRTLRDKRYTKKRGQTVFVRETFVKGKAVTVLSPESEELNNANT